MEAKLAEFILECETAGLSRWTETVQLIAFFTLLVVLFGFITNWGRG